MTSKITEIPKILRGYCKQLYVSKLDNLDEMDTIQETYNFLSLNKNEIDNINTLITSSETEFVLKKRQLQKQKEVQDQTASQGNFTKPIKKS